MRAFLAAGFSSLFLLIVAAAAADAPGALGAFDPASRIRVDHTAWGEFLKSYVAADRDGLNRVAYGRVSAPDADRLNRYIGALEAIDPRSLGRDEAFAYWVNLYNALTVRLIVENYPVKSIRDLKSGPISFGPWGRKLARVAGVDLTLDDIEHKILRPGFGDARVHFAVNCASVGCPNLRAEPWTGEGLDAALDAAAREFVNSPRGLRVSAGRLVGSTIFQWYGSDFGADPRSRLAFLAQFADGALKAELGRFSKIDRFEYDWRLNDAAPAAGL
jgi:hypothetical protein